MSHSVVDIKRVVFSTYHEYVNNGYPSDPNIYVIRASRETIDMLLLLGEEYLTPDLKYDWAASDRFLLFRTHVDNRLPHGDIVFGPEVVDIKWSV